MLSPQWSRNRRSWTGQETGMKIMVVDDSSAMRMLIIRALRQSGISGSDISQAADGSEALDAIRDDPPDLVLADWNMPVMSGIQLLQALRSEGNEVVFGFITTEATDAMRSKAAESGAKFLLSKPFTAESFEHVIAAVMA